MISTILAQLSTGSGKYESGSAVTDTGYDLASAFFMVVAQFFSSFGS